MKIMSKFPSRLLGRLHIKLKLKKEDKSTYLSRILIFNCIQMPVNTAVRLRSVAARLLRL